VRIALPLFACPEKAVRLNTPEKARQTRKTEHTGPPLPQRHPYLPGAARLAVADFPKGAFPHTPLQLSG
jgi:hypothetical protein